MKLKEFLTNKLIRGRKPWSLASDVIFIVLVIMMLVPSTRSLLLSGVASVRTWFSSPGNAERTMLPDGESWIWPLTDGQGRAGTFADLKGEVIFLNQWATWCPPCRAEMPSIEKLYRKYGSQVKFVMLTAEDPVKVKEFMEKHGYTFPVYYGTVRGPALVSRSIPATAIISRTGEVVINRNGAYNWNSGKVRRIVEDLLKE